ncbi:hypothetical protein KBZ21_47490, partial [Streptomyces sp. A73]|nr:hypothetical protein [Streptomyces sp. A73]
PKPKLIDWAAREVAEYVADNWADVESHRDAGREQLVDHLKTRPQKARDAAAARGTSIHAYAEQLVAGEEVEAPEE